MTQAAERLVTKWEEWGLPLLLPELAERVVQVVFNAEIRPFSTLEERLALALGVELGIGSGIDLNDPQAALTPQHTGFLFLMRCIIARMGLEHVEGDTYRAIEKVGSLLGSAQQGWMLRFDRKLSEQEWNAFSERSAETYDEESKQFSPEKCIALMGELFPDMTVVETIRRDAA